MFLLRRKTPARRDLPSNCRFSPRNMMRVYVLLAAFLIATGCSHKTARDFQSYRWLDGTNVLESDRVAKLVTLLSDNLVVPPKTTPRLDPNVPPPALAFDLCVNVQTEDGKIVAQLLGYDERFVEFDGLGSTENSDVVQQIYDIVRNGHSKSQLRPIFVDVNQRGFISIDQQVLTRTNLAEILSEKFHSCTSTPVVIRGDPQVQNKHIRAVMHICRRIGYSRLILADPDANQRSLRVWLSSEPKEKRYQFQPYQLKDGFESFDETTNSLPAPSLGVFIFNDAYVVNGKRTLKDGVRTGLKTFLDTAGPQDKKVFIFCAWDSRNEQLVWLLNVCEKMGLKEIFLTSI